MIHLRDELVVSVEAVEKLCETLGVDPCIIRSARESSRRLLRRVILEMRESTKADEIPEEKVKLDFKMSPEVIY